MVVWVSFHIFIAVVTLSSNASCRYISSKSWKKMCEEEAGSTRSNSLYNEELGDALVADNAGLEAGGIVEGDAGTGGGEGSGGRLTPARASRAERNSADRNSYDSFTDDGRSEKGSFVEPHARRRSLERKGSWAGES